MYRKICKWAYGWQGFVAVMIACIVAGVGVQWAAKSSMPTLWSTTAILVGVIFATLVSFMGFVHINYRHEVALDGLYEEYKSGLNRLFTGHQQELSKELAKVKTANDNHEM